MMRATRATLLVVLFAVGAFALVGCESSPAVDTAELEGTWVLESFGRPTGLVEADPAVTSQLMLEDGEVSGSGGVNSFSGAYEASDEGDITFVEIAATAMAGEPAAMEQEGEFFADLDEAAHFEFNEGKLVLSAQNNDTLMVLAPE